VRSRRRLPFLLILALASAPARAQEPEPVEPPVFLESGSAVALLAGREVPLPYWVTAEGPLFSLAPLAVQLGAELSPLPSGDGYTLRLAGTELLVGTASEQVVVEQRILALSQRPAAVPGGLAVPVDFLERSFGDLLGYAFSWDAAGRRLSIERLSTRELAMWIDVVHLRGTTTVVLQFPEAAPRYRIVEGPRRIEVQLLGDRFGSRVRAPETEDPLLRDIEVSPERVRIELKAGAKAESYVLKQPFRLVFDVHREGAPTAEPVPLAPPRGRAGLRTVVLDPGHGGAETGAVGSKGAVEKDLTLTLAQALKRRLEQRLPVKVVLTRDEDASLPLPTRTAIANQNKADLFISLHLNSSLGSGARGAETYFLAPTASDEHAARSAEAENAPTEAAAGSEAVAAAGSGEDPLFDLQLILWDLAQSRYLAESQRLATLIQEELNSALGLKDRGVKQAPFAVLRGAAMPAVLVELGFLSNPEEEAKLQDPSHRAALVEAVVRAVARYRAAVEGSPEPQAEVEP
jgi:N-acetylmuramoyl-L-alanine amidase